MLADNFGFTLIELSIGIFIVVMMTGLFIVNYHGVNKRSELGVIKQKLASDIRLAQNYSLGSKTYDGVNTPGGGWGVHFSLSDPAHYIIFADKNAPDGNRIYDTGEAVLTRALPAGISINSLARSSSLADPLDIVFFPPDPAVYINGLDNATAQIILKENANNSTATVFVNFFGLIDTD